MKFVYVYLYEVVNSYGYDIDSMLVFDADTFISDGSPTGPDAIQASVGGTIVVGTNETNFATPVDTVGFGAAGGTWTPMTKFGD